MMLPRTRPAAFASAMLQSSWRNRCISETTSAPARTNSRRP